MSDPHTVKTVLEQSAAYVAGAGREYGRLDCELLLARLLKCRRLDLYLRFDHELDETRLAAMRRGIKRLAAGEPVQYILGETDFLGHRLTVDSRALIPRPETEGLVQTVLELDLPPAALFADVGTGSGCIAIALLLARPEWRGVGIDPSAPALELARLNAQRLGVEARLALTGAELADCLEPESLDLLVSNLPYIPSAEVDALPRHIRDFEPRSALDGGPDGLDLIRQLVPDAAFLLKPAGWLALEIGAGQGEDVRALLTGEGFESVAVRPDLAGLDRVALGRLPV